MQKPDCELMLTPKEISAELLRRYGKRLHTNYIRAIRAYTEARGENLFVNREARTSEVYAWLERNKSFSRSKAMRRGSPQIGVV